MLSYVALVGAGFLLGMFYSERSIQKMSTSPLPRDAYVAKSACPAYTLRRVREVLQNDDVAVPKDARQQLRAERRALVAEICPDRDG
jgi:hypothetical protein